MNRKQFILTLVVLLAVALPIFMLMKKDSSSWNSSQYSAAGDKMFADLDLNRISMLKISSGGETSTIRKNDDGSWSVAEKASYPCDYRKISNFLQGFPEMKTVQNVNVGKSQLEKICLGDADQAKGNSTLLEFSGENGSRMASILVGKKHLKKEENPNPYFGGASPDGCYVMLCDGRNQPKLVNSPFDDLSANPLSWTDKALLSIGSISSVEVIRKNPGDGWKMEKDAKTGKLSLPDLKEGEVMDDSKLNPLNSILSHSSFKDVKECPADFAGEVARIESADGFKYEIKFASREGDKYLVNVSVSATIAEQREPGKDEKPEQKEKLDKEFKDKVEKLKEKLAKEKALGKWLYTFMKGDISSLLNTRKNFLKPKEEKKTDAKATVPLQLQAPDEVVQPEDMKEE